METERERKRGKATFEIKQSKYIACFSLYLLYILSDDNNVQMISWQERKKKNCPQEEVNDLVIENVQKRDSCIN
jgi:hypothetical protein